ncbi:MAG: hypothetical protein Q9218_005354 [Villophora microphyllina]
MAQGKILITGAAGFIGFRTLVQALGAGYPVVAVVGSKETADLIRSAPSIKKLNPGSALTFLTIPDITADNAVNEFSKTDIEYIVHTASPAVDHPIGADHYDSQIIQPIVKSTNNVLSAALKNSHVKRVVMTSSEMALIPYMELYQLESFNTFTDASPIPTPVTPYPTVLAALAGARTKALVATNSFLAKNKPHFTVINLMPSVTIGRNELANTTNELLNGGNLQALRHLRGEKVASKVPSSTVHIDDVAKIHVLSLNTQKVDKSQNFMLTSGGISGSPWYEAKDVVKKGFMEDVKKGWLSLSGEQPVNRVMIDDKRTVQVFGIKFIEFEQQIKDVVGQYVELRAKEQKK